MTEAVFSSFQSGMWLSIQSYIQSYIFKCNGSAPDSYARKRESRPLEHHVHFLLQAIPNHESKPFCNTSPQWAGVPLQSTIVKPAVKIHMWFGREILLTRPFSQLVCEPQPRSDGPELPSAPTALHHHIVNGHTLLFLQEKQQALLTTGEANKIISSLLWFSKYGISLCQFWE